MAEGKYFNIDLNNINIFIIMFKVQDLKAVTPAVEDGPALDGDDVGLVGRLQQVEVHEPLHPAQQDVGDLVQEAWNHLCWFNQTYYVTISYSYSKQQERDQASQASFSFEH